MRTGCVSELILVLVLLLYLAVSAGMERSFSVRVCTRAPSALVHDDAC